MSLRESRCVRGLGLVGSFLRRPLLFGGVSVLAACGDGASTDSGEEAVNSQPTDALPTEPGPANTVAPPAQAGNGNDPPPPATPGDPSQSTGGAEPTMPASGGAPAGGGNMSSGGDGPMGGSGGSPGGAGMGTAGRGGASSGGTAVGGAGNPSGGAPPGGASAGGAPGGSGGSGGAAPTGECTRELLQSTLDAYFEALAAQDPSTLPLADTVKFTENGEEMELGSGGLWQTAGAVEYSHSAFDVESCMSATQAAVPDGNTPIPLALRLRLESGLITEIETIAVRQGDYILGSNTDAMAASADVIGWEDPVAEADRATREQLTSWMDKYFRLFPAGVCNTTGDCQRLENGGGNFVCSSGASCAAEDPGPDDENLLPRLILADEERGLGIGFTMFQNQYSDMHMFKMYGGQVYAVHAILAEASGSGWD